MNQITKNERKMLRQGDLLNPIGVFRAALINKGFLKKKHFINLIKKNYLYDNQTELPEYMITKIGELPTPKEVGFVRIPKFTRLSQEKS